jgi:hypothetical protein
MDEHDAQGPSRLVSVPGLIAWLSLCMLAAAWGRTLDVRWQESWAQIGAFGLAAAVGLGGLEQARLYRANWISEQSVRLRFAGRLALMSEQSDALESIHEAIRRLAKHAAAERHGHMLRPASANGSLALSNYPLDIIPVDENGAGFEIGSPHAIPGWLRKISSSAVSFEHDRAFSERVVVLAFKLGEHGPLCFVVDVKWTQRSSDHFASSGAVMAVGVPAKRGTESTSDEGVHDA